MIFLMLVDLRPFSITGKELEHRLDEVYITVNKNAIHNDPEKPFVTSGIRLGAAAVTTRGFDEKAMAEIANIISEAIKNADDAVKLKSLRERSLALCKQFPLYE